MSAFNDIPEEKIHIFLKEYGGSEEITDIKAKIGTLISIFG
jgi:hypothetical protein